MSSGFLLSTALTEALRKPYHRGDVDVTVQYLVEGLAIGEYRVMLKRNFDTACWVPPAGRRDSHSIYYGDRMVARVIDFYLQQAKIEGVPDVNTLAEAVKSRLEAKPKGRTAKAALPSAPVKVTRSDVLDEKLNWLKVNLAKAEWDLLVEKVVKAVKAYGRHERQHARNTPQDLKQVNKDLKYLGIPFMYFNLFEDARIEHISRQEMGDAFEWLDLEEIAPRDNPFNMLLRCIQLEGAPDLEALESDEPFKADDARTVGIVADSVEGYYKRAIECSQAEQMYPIIVEFLREFKEDLPPPPDEKSGKDKGKGKGKGSGAAGEGEGEGGSGSGSDGDGEDDDGTGVEERAGDLSTAAEAAEKGDEFFAEFESDAEVVGGTDAKGKEADAKAKGHLRGENDKAPPKGKGNGQGIPDSIAPTASGGRASENEFLASRPGSVDDAYRRRIDNLTEMLLRMFKAHNLPAYSEIEGRRMSGRHLARGELKYVHKKVMGGKGKRKFTVVFDCSGSMGMNNGKPAREGKLLLLAFNNLARRGFLEGNLVLSGYVRGQPSWLQYKFPVKEELILRIDPNHGAEGLQNTLQDNLANIKGMDDVFVYTDACITDAPINREMFARNRIWPVGLYVGSEASASEMERHFPQNIIRDTIEAVVETMLTRNRRTVS